MIYNWPHERWLRFYHSATVLPEDVVSPAEGYERWLEAFQEAVAVGHLQTVWHTVATHGAERWGLSTLIVVEQESINVFLSQRLAEGVVPRFMLAPDLVVIRAAVEATRRYNPNWRTLDPDPLKALQLAWKPALAPPIEAIERSPIQLSIRGMQLVMRQRMLADISRWFAFRPPYWPLVWHAAALDCIRLAAKPDNRLDLHGLYTPEEAESLSSALLDRATHFSNAECRAVIVHAGGLESRKLRSLADRIDRAIQSAKPGQTTKYLREALHPRTEFLSTAREVFTEAGAVMGLTDQEIGEHIWRGQGIDEHADDDTLRVLVNRIRRKKGLPNRPPGRPKKPKQ